MSLTEALALLVIAALVVWGFGFRFRGLPGRDRFLRGEGGGSDPKRDPKD